MLGYCVSCILPVLPCRGLTRTRKGGGKATHPKNDISFRFYILCSTFISSFNFLSISNYTREGRARSQGKRVICSVRYFGVQVTSCLPDGGFLKGEILRENESRLGAKKQSALETAIVPLWRRSHCKRFCFAFRFTMLVVGRKKDVKKCKRKAGVKVLSRLALLNNRAIAYSIPSNYCVCSLQSTRPENAL